MNIFIERLDLPFANPIGAARKPKNEMQGFGAHAALHKNSLAYLETHCQNPAHVVRINTCGYQFGDYIPLFLPERGLCV
jgi:hypothetical protein